LNRLYYDHQIALIRAAGTPSRDLTLRLATTASEIAGRIGCIQRGLSAGAAPGWDLLALDAPAKRAGLPS
jgi:hypothetical protein